MATETGVMFRREQDPATLISYAQRVESMGFDQLWVVEDCFYHGGIAQVAIAHAFPGRLIGGIGHGVAGWMEQIGAKPASWLTSISEITTAVRRIMRGERVTVDGRYVHLTDVQLEKAPEVVPPVLLGVQSEKSVRLSGECADGILIVEGSGVEYVSWARDLMNEGRAAAGQPGAGHMVVFANCVVDDADPASARQVIREQVALGNGTDLAVTVRRMPFASEMAELLAQGGADALREGMPDEWLSRLSITGSNADARLAVANYASVGAEAVILVPPEDADWDVWLEKQAWATSPEE